MRILTTASLTILPELVKSTLTATPPLSGISSPRSDPIVNWTSAWQLPAKRNVSGPVTILDDYPIDPYQMRVSGTTTSLIFSKYGPPIYHETFLNLIAKAQYQIIQEVVAAHGDEPISQPNFEWSQGKLYIRISRPLAQQDLTWSMLADTLEGMREFFDGQRGWFETAVTVLDDVAGPVGSGSVEYW